MKKEKAKIEQNNNKQLRRCPGKSYWIEKDVCEARQQRGWCKNKKCKWKKEYKEEE